MIIWWANCAEYHSIVRDIPVGTCMGKFTLHELCGMSMRVP